jgi:acyl-CoA thioesterase-1
MRRALVTLLVVFLAACNGDSGTSTTTGPGPVPTAPVVVVLGDSLTAGPGLRTDDAYPAVLQERARAAGLPHRFVNAGVSSDTTADALRRLDSALVPETRVLVVALGANDGLQAVPVDTVKQNLRQIIQRARTRGILVLLAGMESLPNHGLDYTIRFHNIFPELTAEFNVPLMPFLLQNVFGRADLNLPDGFHPNAAGMRVIAAEMWPFLEPLLRATSSARPSF